MHLDTDVVLRKANRLQAKTPHKGICWCGRCDHALVGDGQKCGVCGTRRGRGKFKPRDIPLM